MFWLLWFHKNLADRNVISKSKKKFIELKHIKNFVEIFPISEGGVLISAFIEFLFL